MKPHKQTTSAVSSIAGKYVRMKNNDMAYLVDGWFYGTTGEKKTAAKFFSDFRKVCASALAQDEKKGQGK